MSESPQLITRREALKRGAIVGGTVLWAVPVVQTLGMGRAYAQTPSDQCIASWATEVYLPGTSQGLNRDLTNVLPERSNPNNALGAPTQTPENPGEKRWFSLGFGGEIVLKLGVPYYSGKNGEALVIETTTGSYPLEEAEVYVGEPGAWVNVVTTAKNTGAPALQMSLDTVPGLPTKITHVKIVDISNTANFPQPQYDEADGFDVNAVGIGCP